MSGYNDIDDYDFQTMCLSNLLELHLYEYALKSAPNAYFYSRYVHHGRLELCNKPLQMIQNLATIMHMMYLRVGLIRTILVATSTL